MKVEWERTEHGGRIQVDVFVEEDLVVAIYGNNIETWRSGTCSIYMDGKCVGDVYGTERHTCKAKPPVCDTCGKEMP